MSLERADGLLNKHWATDNIPRDWGEAMRTIVACGDVLERLDAAWQNKNQEQYSEYNEGYTDALDMAEQWLKQALDPSSAN